MRKNLEKTHPRFVNELHNMGGRHEVEKFKDHTKDMDDLTYADYLGQSYVMVFEKGSLPRYGHDASDYRIYVLIMGKLAKGYKWFWNNNKKKQAA